MSKKKRFKKIFESASIESADVNAKSTESVAADAQGEETSPDTNPQEEMIETPSAHEESFTENALVSEEANTEITEPVAANVQDETTSSGESLTEGMETSMDSEESSTSGAAEEESNEDLLDDVRRSLIEEEGDKDQKE